MYDKERILSMSVLILSLFSNVAALSNFDNFVFNGVAFAQAVDNEVGDGINPDSFFYGLDIFIDDIVLAFTSGDVEKAELSLKIAEERLQEVKMMIEENKLSAAQAAQAEHDKMLSVTENAVSQIESADAVEEIKEKIEVEKELKEHKTKVEKISGELKVKIKIKSEITAEQQSLIDSILTAMEGKTGEVEIKIDNEKQETKIRIKQQTGKSTDEIKDEVEELEVEAGVAGLEVKAEILGEQSEVKVEREFSTATTDRSAIVDEIIEEFALGRETADASLEIETEEEEEELEEKLEVKIEIEEGVADVEIELKFVLDTTDREEILNAIVERTQLTREQIEEALEFEADEEELEIEVEIEGNKSKVKVEFAGKEIEFELDTIDRETIISEIVARTGLTREQVESMIEIGIEEELEEIEEEETEELEEEEEEELEEEEEEEG